MFIYLLDALKKSSKKKETRITKEIVELLQKTSYRCYSKLERVYADKKLKDQNDKTLSFDLEFVG